MAALAPQTTFQGMLGALRAMKRQRQSDAPDSLEISIDGVAVKIENSKAASWKQILNKVAFWTIEEATAATATTTATTATTATTTTTTTTTVRE